MMLKQQISGLCKEFQVTLIAGEFRSGEVSVASKAAEECGIAPSLQVDMNSEERKLAGIDAVLKSQGSVKVLGEARDPSPTALRFPLSPRERVSIRFNIPLP